MYKSVQSWLHWTAQTTLLCSCLCVLSLGWTSFCLSVLVGLKWTRMWNLLKILLSFSDFPATERMMMFLHFPVFSSLSALDLLRGFDKGPVRVTRELTCSPDVLLLHFLSLCLRWHPQLVLQWVMIVEQQVLICVCRFSVHLSVEACVFTVQEGQTVSSDIFPGEIDVIVYSLSRFSEGPYIPCFEL